MLKIQARYMLWAVLFLLLCTAATVLLYFIVLPVYRLHAAHDAYMHFHQKTWDNAQKIVKRIGWIGDTSLYVGTWGNEGWVAQIIDDLTKNSEETEGCRPRYGALAMISNQYLGEDFALWQAWWKANKHKTQEDWIKEGFKSKGYTLTDPLDAPSILALLEILGKEDSSSATEFNAFRWLRDSDFAVDAFHYDSIPKDKGNIILMGIKKYCQLAAIYPKQCAPHALAIGKETTDCIASGFPLIYSAWFVVIWAVFLSVSFSAAVFFLVKAVNLDKR